LAWVLVGSAFRAGLINSPIDMPFAVSPVVVGYMLLLLFGRNVYGARPNADIRAVSPARDGPNPVRDYLIIRDWFRS
jgi:ABC-type sulfate transport system permease subunit